MTKIAFISDLHLKTHKSSEAFLPHIARTIDLFIEETEKRKIKTVFILGDVFHVKHTISTYTQNVAIDSLNKIFKKFNTYMIPGNHDILSKGDTSINSLKIFKDSCHLFEDYTQVQIEGDTFHFIPYFQDSILLNKIKNVQLNFGKNFLCSHIGFRGFILDNNHEDIYSEIEVGDIDRGFDRIFSGHYHSFQTRGKVTYISSPYESHFNDEGHHGFVFYDTSTDHIEFFENHLSPRFVSTELNAQNLDYINTIENSFIKLIIKKHIDNQVLLKFKEKLLKKNFDVLFNFDLATTSSKIAIAKSWEEFVNEGPEEILTSYVNDNSSLPNEFNKKELLEYIGI
jgi:DNA repair exonuclease SbcCD nuclease subunit